MSLYFNSQKSTLRESWIDVLKGVGMIFVIIGHVSKHNALNTWIYTFHMPLFFALSGFLWSKSKKKISFNDFFIKRVKSILWPFCLFRMLLIIYWILIESYFRSLDLGPIWFLIVLFVAEILGYLLQLNKKESAIYNLALIFIFAAIWIQIREYDFKNIVYEWILRCISGFLWYLIGHLAGLLTKKYKNNLERNYRDDLYALIIVSFFVSVFMSRINPNVSIWSNDYGMNYFFYFVGGISGSIFVTLFCRLLIIKNNFLEFLGRNTIVVLATHEPIKRVVLKISQILLLRFGLDLSIDILQNKLVYSLIITAIVLILSSLTIRLFQSIKKIMPVFIQRNFLDFVV